MKPVTFDGALLMVLAMGPALIGWICGDEAAKFMPDWVIFYLKGLLAVAIVGVGALKSFRSTQFAQYKANGGGDPSYTGVVLPTAPPVVTTKTTTTITPPLPPPPQPAPVEAVAKTIVVVIGFAVVWMFISAGCTHKPSTLAVTPEQSAETVNRLEQQIKTNLNK